MINTLMSLKRLLPIGTFLMSLGIGLLTSASADDLPSLPHPLPDDVLLSRAVATSDAVLLGRVADLFFTTAGINQIPHVRVSVTRWLQNSTGADTLTFWIPTDNDKITEVFQTARHSQQLFLLFLTRVLDTWMLNTGPGVLGDGFLTLTAPSAQHYINSVQHEIRAQSIDSLTSASHLVILGHVIPLRPGRAQRQDTYYYHVDSVIAGTAPDTAIEITTPCWLDLMGRTQKLLFLRHITGDRYEVVRGGAGSMILRNGRVLRHNMKLSTATREVRQRISAAGGAK